MMNMKDISEKLRQYFDQQPSVSYGDAGSILEALFWLYTENNNLDNEIVRQQFSKLREYLKLPPDQYDEVFYIVSTLCIIHGQEAFSQGVRIGFAFSRELSEA